MLARALVLSPDLLILDEPFDGLDQQFRSHLVQLLQDYSKKITLIIVANRLSDLDGLASHLACVDQGATVYRYQRRFSTFGYPGNHVAQSG